MTSRGMAEASLAEQRNAEALWLAENKRIARIPQFRIRHIVKHRADFS